LGDRFLRCGLVATWREGSDVVAVASPTGASSPVSAGASGIGNRGCGAGDGPGRGGGRVGVWRAWRKEEKVRERHATRNRRGDTRARSPAPRTAAQSPGQPAWKRLHDAGHLGQLCSQASPTAKGDGKRTALRKEATARAMQAPSRPRQGTARAGSRQPGEGVTSLRRTRSVAVSFHVPPLPLQAATDGHEEDGEDDCHDDQP